MSKVFTGTLAGPHGYKEGAFVTQEDHQVVETKLEALQVKHKDMAVEQAKAEAKLIIERDALRADLRAEMTAKLAYAKAAQVKIQELLTDAERYRYLRNSPHFNSDKDRLEWYLPRRYTDRGTIAERLDRSIDQSMKEIPK